MEQPSPSAAKFALALARARVRALDAGLDLCVTERQPGEWLVPSISRPQLHVVRRRHSGWSCDCLAGTHHHPCCHVAAVTLRIERN